MPKVFNRNHLKLIALAAMLLDHTAALFLVSTSPAYFVLRFLGRLAAPIMAFFVAEGYKYTKDVKKYLLRLVIFWLISWIPFSLAFEGGLPIEVLKGSIPGYTKALLIDKYKLYYQIFSKNAVVVFRMKTDVFFTLALGLVALIIVDKKELNSFIKVVSVAFLCAVSMLGDWKYYNVLLPLIFYYFHDNVRLKNAFFYVVSAVKMSEIDKLYKLYFTGMLGVPILLSLYNGEYGRKNKFFKWFYYVFYPFHLVLLLIIKNFLI